MNRRERRVFWKTVDQASDAVFQHLHIEVAQKPDLAI